MNFQKVSAHVSLCTLLSNFLHVKGPSYVTSLLFDKMDFMNTQLGYVLPFVRGHRDLLNPLSLEPDLYTKK